MEQKVKPISTVKIRKSDDMYKVVDSLNRTLKDRDLMFGLSYDQNDKDRMVFTIYET
ncbi:YpmA family protein [Alteribacter natronophilus]|uniref:YpmA family protein n=1 Tax=Alteribacter natronophilus TaxID=2583810 RepID=UPI00110E472C|nr:YpmA family protein [Alteribacter natronophilus]TMW73562.1 DUF4264 domain-containing protein [Alteribacter natronophilus]